MSPRNRRQAVALLVLTSVIGLSLAGVGHAERTQEGNLIGSIDAELTPRTLPREGAAPVTLSLKSNFSTVDGGPLPQLRRIAVVFSNNGVFDTSLPICRESEIAATTTAGAMHACGDALVGHGRLVATIALPGQEESRFVGRLLAFNGASSDGRPVILADAHSKRPPVSFVMRFVHRTIEGTEATALVAKMPKSAGKWAHIRRFELTLGRRFEKGGEERSFVSAGCNAQPGFDSLVFPFAEATYGFAGGDEVQVAAIRRCLVEG